MQSTYNMSCSRKFSHWKRFRGRRCLWSQDFSESPREHNQATQNVANHSSLVIYMSTWICRHDILPCDNWLGCSNFFPSRCIKNKIHVKNHFRWPALIKSIWNPLALWLSIFETFIEQKRKRLILFNFADWRYKGQICQQCELVVWRNERELTVNG